MIALFTDFGAEGPYLGEMINVLNQHAPAVPVINLLSNAPVANPQLSAYLLAALTPGFAKGTVFLCVVDPGVGGERLPVVLQADGRIFVGPDNGLLNTVAVQAKKRQWWSIEWRPERLSNSFHGRDLFAPMAAALALGDASDRLEPFQGPDLATWPIELEKIIYIDHYGNAMTGLRYTNASIRDFLTVNGARISHGRTFESVAKGEPVWYENSSGLVEIAVNRGRADQQLGLALGDPVEMAFSLVPYK